MSKSKGLISSRTGCYLILLICLYDVAFRQVDGWTYLNLACALYWAVAHVNQQAAEKAQAERKDKGDKL